MYKFIKIIKNPTQEQLNQIYPWVIGINLTGVLGGILFLILYFTGVIK